MARSRCTAGGLEPEECGVTLWPGVQALPSLCSSSRLSCGLWHPGRSHACGSPAPNTTAPRLRSGPAPWKTDSSRGPPSSGGVQVASEKRKESLRLLCRLEALRRLMVLVGCGDSATSADPRDRQGFGRGGSEPADKRGPRQGLRAIPGGGPEPPHVEPSGKLSRRGPAITPLGQVLGGGALPGSWEL